MLSAEEDGPCDAAGVLALEEQGLGLAVLETEDLAVAADVDLTLQHVKLSAFLYKPEMCALPLGRRVCSFNRPARSDNDADSPLVIAASTSSASWIWEGIGLCVYLSRVDLRAGEGVVVGTHLDLFPPTVLLGVDGCRLLASLSLASRDFRLPTVDLGQMFSLMKLCTNQLAPRASKVQFNARVGAERRRGGKSWQRGTPKRDRKYIEVTFFISGFMVE